MGFFSIQTLIIYIIILYGSFMLCGGGHFVFNLAEKTFPGVVWHPLAARYDIYFYVSIWLLYFKADFNSLWTGSYYKTWTPLKIYIELNLTLPWRKSAKSNNLYIILILWWFNLRHLNIIIETEWHYIYKSVLLSETDQIYTLKCIKWSIPCQQN